MRAASSLLLILSLMGMLPEHAEADEQKKGPTVDTVKLGLKARLGTAAVPPAPKKGYKIGQRVVYTIWLDNDDPYAGMQDVVLWMPDLPDYMRLDLSLGQPDYGNIFVDSRVPVLSDTPTKCRAYYISKDRDDLLNLTPDADSSNLKRVLWVITRGKSEEVVKPHDEDDNMWGVEKADTTFGAEVDSDEMYVRYATIVVEKPGRSKKK